MQENVDNSSDSLRAMASDSKTLISSEYTVEERDTIADIEKKHGISWKAIVEANQDILKDSEVLKPGLRLKIPSR